VTEQRFANSIAPGGVRGGCNRQASNLKTHQPTKSALRKARLKSITYDRLVGWLVLLARIVEIHVEPTRKMELHVEVAIAG
jgi:hypothetical protein